MNTTLEEIDRQLASARATLKTWSTEGGGPAFPHLNPAGEPMRGMSLRDYFAGQALSGLCTGTPRERDTERLLKIMADAAYNIADAMLARREEAQP